MSLQNALPKISIIMPTFNRAAFILETIESIRKQTYACWELIIMDDGSEDNTEELISRLQDDRIQYYREARSGLVGRLKNIGIQKATGDLYAFMDSDDLWADKKLELQVSALQQFPRAGFCLTGGYNFNIALQPVEFFYKQRHGEKTGKVFNDFFSSELPGFTQALMIKKECLQKAGLFKETVPFSDMEFILSLAWNYEAVILYEPLLFRRLHNDNHSTDAWQKSYMASMAVIASCKRNGMINAKSARKSLFSLYLNFGGDCVLHQEWKKAFDNYFRAFRQMPFNIIPFKKALKTAWQFLKK